MGQSKQQYDYDDLNRLIKATGEYQVKRHDHEDDSGEGDDGHNDDNEYNRPHGIYTDRYQLDLAYDPIHNLTQKVQRHERVNPKGKVKRVRDTSYAWHYGYTARRPHAPEQIGRRHFLYDNNGNLFQSNTQDDQDHDEHAGKDNYHEEGAIHYVYNERDERVIKHVHDEEIVYVNSLYVVKNHGIVTKNILAGSNRLVSKVHHRHHHRDSDGEGSTKRYEHGPYLFYYQPNHLGSTQFITDRQGELYQHLEDFPFGETWVDEGHRPSIDYRFTGKELDAETGLVYFGARYYDPRTSVWISADPADRFGAHAPTIGLNLYQYALHNPLQYIDPDGQAEMPYWQDARFPSERAYWESARNICAMASCHSTGGTFTRFATGAEQDQLALITAATLAAPFVARGLGTLASVPAVAASLPMLELGLAASSDGPPMPIGLRSPNMGQKLLPAPMTPKLLPAPNKAPNMLSRGSTGRTEPRNLQEKLAMDQVKSNPGGTMLENIKMTDPRWHGNEGWVKMQQIVETSKGKVNIHYLRNTKTGVLDDFKYK